MQRLLLEGSSMEEELIAFRRDLHRHPELSFQESRTAQRVAEALIALGLQVRTGVGGHGIVADLVGSRAGRTIALRADMDALPIREETGLAFASEREGVMHACGHDAHTSILLGAARILVGRKDELEGSVRFIFQSAEEINAGARAMIEAGVLEGVDEIYGLHNLPTLSAGKIATRHGNLMGSVDRIEITLEGRGGHGAIPDQTVDPIVAASAIIQGLQTAASREVSPFDPIVVTIGSIHAGEANNVIPQRCELTGTVRTFSPEVQRGMRERLERIILRIAEGYRCQASVRYIEQTPVLVNHSENVTHVERVVDELIGSARRVEAAPTMAGEDFSFYVTERPGCFFWLGSGPAENAHEAYGLHHPKFDINEQCLSLGASVMAAIAFRRLIVDNGQ
ncbi:amidohydrolase [Paenibacillus cremeus]|uniref:Amidohydrolase n=2 Tax=Paenibacillus cremeus TaxID=2163881 RepID=A0A559KEX4_9BACL|nr:amidohydrolase [Paenibacillus cremeus]